MEKRQFISQHTHLHMESWLFWFWFGREGISIWDKKKGKKFYIGYFNQTLPYVPGFSDIWECVSNYQDEVWKITGKPILKPRVALIVPEDISKLERRALEDFCFLTARAREVILLTQSMVLYSPLEDYIALTLTCRTCCIALMKDGEVKEREFFAVSDCTRESVKENLQKFRRSYQGETLQVYYPEMEESELLSGQGTAVPFEKMMEECLAFSQAAGKKFL